MQTWPCACTLVRVVYCSPDPPPHVLKKPRFKHFNFKRTSVPMSHQEPWRYFQTTWKVPRPQVTQNPRRKWPPSMVLWLPMSCTALRLWICCHQKQRRSARSHQKSEESQKNGADSNFHYIIFCFGNWLYASATFLQPCLGLILMVNSWCASLFQNLLIYRIRIAESSLQSGYYTNCWWNKRIEPWLWLNLIQPPKVMFCLVPKISAS